MLRFFMSGFVPSNYIETDKVKLFKKTEQAQLYDVIGDKYASKILEVVDIYGDPIYTQVPADSFVLDKFIISQSLLNAGYTAAICAYLDTLHYNTVGELVFVQDHETKLDERI
jgi:hypothetical protein